jgi:glycogen operon protein
MLLMGDEMRRTQGGNNNAYCQDNEVSWLDWSLLDQHEDLHRFVKRLIQLRLSLDVFKYDHGLSLTQLLRLARVQWHGIMLNEPDWGDNSHSLAFTVQGRREHFHIILNAYWEALEFELPVVKNGAGWRRVVDTYLEAPEDICEPSVAPQVDSALYVVQPRSVVILATERDGG